MRLLPIEGRQVVVRTEATQACYTTVGALIGATTAPSLAGASGAIPNAPTTPVASFMGHGGVGVVEAIGPDVRRVRVGDRVVCNVLPGCSRCYGCVTGRRHCEFSEPLRAVAEMADGTRVMSPFNGGGFNELMVVSEEYAIPVDSALPAAELALLSCVSGCGLSMAYTMGIDRGSDVVVFGAGPVGMSSVQGARILGARQIIVVEPIKQRRDLARKVGATAVFDPKVEGADLLPKITDMCKGSDRLFAGGLPTNRPKGPDYIIEAVGSVRWVEVDELGPIDGVEVLKQVWDLCPDGGKLYTCSVHRNRTLTLAAGGGQFTDRGRTHYATTNGSQRPLRDIPRNANLIERGLFDAKSMLPLNVSLEDLHDAARLYARYQTFNVTYVAS